MGRRNRSKRREDRRPDRGGPHPTARNRRRWAVAGLAAVALVAVLVGGGLLARGLSSGGGQPDGPKTAAIVDQLSLTVPNPEFIESARSLLHEAGYLVDYYPGEEVTVEFYRNLPTHDYDLIILRVHSAGVRQEGVDRVNLFTSDLVTSVPDDLKPGYWEEGRAGLLRVVAYSDDGPEYFGIPPSFIESSMRGKFRDTTVVMMGCDGLRFARLGEAFLKKGANSFISWNQPVSASHTDAATERLLHNLFLEGLPAQEAVTQTMADVGPDPFWGAELRILSDEG